jgi:hypothetical protein
MNEYYGEKDGRVCLGNDASASVRFGDAFLYGKSREELDAQQSYPKSDLTSRSNDLQVTQYEITISTTDQLFLGST